MAHEVDYIAVGEGERSATAIALRYGNLTGPRNQQFVMVIDGGTLEAGGQLVEHVKKYYGTDTVDLVVLTHPDSDHASGLREVIEKLKVGQIAMHLPWEHSSDVRHLLEESDASADSIRQKTRRNLTAAREIEALAKARGIPIVEPFAGIKTPNGSVTILGPTREFYQQMLANFRFMPGAPAPSGIASAFARIAEAVVNFISESWATETLREPAADATSPENNSSVVLLLQIDGKKLLFTGDAGVTALSAAVSFAETNGISLGDLSFFDVPHHGSRKNLSPTILNRIFGAPRATDATSWVAFISAAKDGAPKHPNKKVTNALRRRGGNVHVTAGVHIWHRHNVGPRQGWTDHLGEPFHSSVEDDD